MRCDRKPLPCVSPATATDLEPVSRYPSVTAVGPPKNRRRLGQRTLPARTGTDPTWVVSSTFEPFDYGAGRAMHQRRTCLPGQCCPRWWGTAPATAGRCSRVADATAARRPGRVGFWAVPGPAAARYVVATADPSPTGRCRPRRRSPRAPHVRLQPAGRPMGHKGSLPGSHLALPFAANHLKAARATAR